MARSLHVHAPAARAARWAGQAAELLLLLVAFSLVALWLTGAPMTALLPVHPPA